MDINKEYSVEVAPDFLKGYTPIKGVDYFTETEKSQFVEEVTNRVNSVITPEEETRGINEEQREANEKERIKAENARVLQESIRQENETLRQNNEEIRQNNEETRKANEQNRISAEQNRTATFDAQIVKNENAINDIKDKTSEYNENATEKTNTFNDNATAKTNQYNSNYSSTLEEFNMNAQNKIDEYNENAKPLTDEIEAIKAKNIEQTTEIESLKSENTLLKSQIPSTTVVGETVHLEDSSNMPCQITPLGASKQETREGYNLLPQMVETTTTFQGRTYTSNGKGALSMTGVATGSGEVTFNLEKPILLGEENLYVHLSNNYATAGLGIRFLNENTRLFEILPTSVNMIENIGTTYAEQTITAIQIFQNDSNSFDMTIQPMICTSNSSLEFEQYGASPSIEYESTIESVGDNINLFDKDNASTLNGYIDNNGYFQYNTSNKITYIECKKNKNYAVSSKHLRGLGFLNEIPKTGLTSTNFKIQNTTELKLNSGENSYLAIWYYDTSSTLTEQEILDSIKICEGTSTGAYSPYGQGSIEIYNCNKNLLNKDNLIIGNNVYGNVGEDVSYAKTDLRYCIIPENAIECKPNNGVTMFINNSNYSFSLAQLDENKKFISDSGWKTGVYSIKTSSTTKYLVCNIRKADNSTVNIDELKKQEIQLEKGETATEYVEHQSQTKALYTQQPFRAIGDVKDRFVKLDGVDYERHPVYRKIFDGTEEISYISQEGNQYVFQITLPGKLLGFNDLRSSHFKVKSSVEWGEDGIVKRDDTSEYIYVYISRSDFRNWLVELYNAGTPVYIDYVLAEPLLIPCTPKQVEVLESFNTYKNVTNISSDSIGELEVIYSKDLETLYNNLSQAVLGGN